MRDPKRIREIVKLLEKVWKKFPEFRLGQLLENVATAEGQSGHCIFYTEDDAWVKFLQEYAPSGKLSKVTLRKLGKVTQAVGRLIKLEARRERGKRNPKRRTFLGSGYKFPECLMPGGGKTGYGYSKVGKRKKPSRKG